MPASGSTASTAAPAEPSFEEAWAASLAALEALGPTRVNIVETTEGRVTGDGITPQQSAFGPLTEEAEQLFDVAGGRARLTVHTSDRRVETTVVRGKERTSTISQPLTNSDLVSVNRKISLQAPDGLPLALWAGNAVGPTQGYADLFQSNESGGGRDALRWQGGTAGGRRHETLLGTRRQWRHLCHEPPLGLPTTCLSESR